MSLELSKSNISSSSLWNTCGNESPVEKLHVSETGGYSAHPAVESDGSEWAGRQPLVTPQQRPAHTPIRNRLKMYSAPSSEFPLLFHIPLEFSSISPKRHLTQISILKIPLHICVRVTGFKMHGNYFCDHPCGHRVFQS